MTKNFASEWLNATQVADLFNVTNMTVWRWERDVNLNFPPPNIVRDRKYWNRDDLNTWMRQQPSKTRNVA